MPGRSAVQRPCCCGVHAAERLSEAGGGLPLHRFVVPTLTSQKDASLGWATRRRFRGYNFGVDREGISCAFLTF